ncbi:Glutamyl-tRNAGlu reductase, dimerisation domain [Halovenus aranensis]|uniref:Glutamyl-tRNAGlu reductase, dimerisation domain n=1 Tax=Halovenus aranensis TaxID=890420 RepID=A0A1G8VS28_9EURY|nr:hypothetical protein [Halovenus aranensis]SDJ68822.1 Glutamyl-tRNAGlu reductase, dimerisation domain [Halovenus aranensis]
MSTDAAHTSEDDPTEAAVEAIRRRRSHVRRDALEQAVSSIGTDRRQALVLSALSHRLTRRLTAAPIEALEQTDDPAVGEVALWLFEMDGGQSE